MKISTKQECIPVGCVPSAAVAVGGGAGCLPGGVCPGDVSAWGGVCPSACWDTHPPPVNRITDACENITMLRMVIRMNICNTILSGCNERWFYDTGTRLTDEIPIIFLIRGSLKSYFGSICIGAKAT